MNILCATETQGKHRGIFTGTTLNTTFLISRFFVIDYTSISYSMLQPVCTNSRIINRLEKKPPHWQDNLCLHSHETFVLKRKYCNYVFFNTI